MGNKKNKSIYKYQPELYLSIIFWSLTFGILFIGIVGLFEETALNLFSVVMFVLFLFVFWLGNTRHLVVTQEQIKQHAILKRNCKDNMLSDFETLSIGRKGVTLTHKNGETFSYLMKDKTKELFVQKLKKNPLFSAKIVGFKQE